MVRWPPDGPRAGIRPKPGGGRAGTGSQCAAAGRSTGRAGPLWSSHETPAPATPPTTLASTGVGGSV
jgi:hypothetical protein